jgi:tRNA pseudouridine55 synthase
MTQATPTQGPDGEMLLVDKPAGWTSFDVVAKLRGALGVRKAGHAGTLDPMATGLLIVCTGARTKEMESFIGLDKEYEVEMTIGARTESFDAETPVVDRRDISAIKDADVEAVLRGFLGPQHQVPPMWSAVKVHGKALYRYARKGQTVERAPREIVIHSIEPGPMDLPRVRFRMACSKGTYVRSLVDTAGERLGCGAYVTALRRTRIGPYRIEDALSIPELVQRAAAVRTAPRSV